MWVGSGYQKETDAIGLWYKLLIVELPFEKIRLTDLFRCRVIQCLSVHPVSQSKCHGVPRCRGVSRSQTLRVTIPLFHSMNSNPLLLLVVQLCTSFASQTTFSPLSLYGKLHYKNHLIYLGSSINQSQANLLIMFGSHLNCINYFWNGLIFFSLGPEWI